MYDKYQKIEQHAVFGLESEKPVFLLIFTYPPLLLELPAIILLGF
jgi:hypothetical protein